MCMSVYFLSNNKSENILYGSAKSILLVLWNINKIIFITEILLIIILYIVQLMYCFYKNFYDFIFTGMSHM